MDAAVHHTPQPILSAAEAWHLARWQLAEKLLATPPEELAASIQEALEASRESYLETANLPSEILQSPEKLSAELREGMPFPIALWPTTDEEIRDTWGFVDMTDEGDTSFTMIAPFRPVAINNMPDGTQVIRIRDTRHSATAAIVEAMTCAKRDLQAVLALGSEDVAWRRANTVIAVYRQAAKIVFQNLSEEDFHNWNPAAPDDMEISNAPALIAQIAATAKAQSVLAFQVIAAWTQAVVDSANQAKESPAKAIQHISDALDAMEGALQAFNKTLLLRSKISPHSVTTMVVFRPIPHSIPVLLAIPKEASDNVHPLRQR